MAEEINKLPAQQDSLVTLKPKIFVKFQYRQPHNRRRIHLATKIALYN